MGLLDLTAELTGRLPGLSPILAQKFVNRALQHIYGERLWSFLLTDAGIVCPAQITNGNVAIVQYSQTVVCDAVASVNLLAQADGTAQPGLTNLAIRFGANSPSIGQVYNIETVDFLTDPTAIVLTLDRPVMEATQPAAGYQCYRAYIIPPYSDFLAWQSVVDMVNAFPLRTNVTSSMFDLRDPQRQAQGLAYFVGSYAGAYVRDISQPVVPNPNVEPGSNVFELWPCSTQGQTLYARVRRKGVPLLYPSETQPAVISDGLVIARVLAEDGYAFAQANVASFPTFKNANWPTLIRLAQVQYATDLQQAKRLDDESALQTVWSTGHGLRQGVRDFKGLSDFPIDSNFLQSHLVRF